MPGPAPRAGSRSRTSGNRLPLRGARAVKENDVVKRLMWSGLLAGFGAISSIVAQRAATVVWRRLFAEEPPE